MKYLFARPWSRQRVMFAGLQRRFFAILLVSGVYGMPADTAYADEITRPKGRLGSGRRGERLRASAKACGVLWVAARCRASPSQR